MDLSPTHHRLQDWYRVHGRHHLPWRNTDDPYAIYISEMMLQQTQVQTVLERFYHPFMTRFPTLTSLAETTQEDVLKMWEGLGYYRRAKYVYKTAQQAGNSLPATVENLMKLPGIGRNTASAIAAFAYHQPVAIMEANIKRILHRVFALESASDTILWQKAEWLLDRQHPFDYNQAMMDIGSFVCTVSHPKCSQCPLQFICQGKENPQLYPKKQVQKITPVRKKNIIVFTAQDLLHIRPRESELLHGLYGFAEYDTDAPVVFEGQAYPISLHAKLGSIRQTYSHFKLMADVYKIEITKRQSNDWRTVEEIKTLPLSKADEKVVRLLHFTVPPSP